MRRPDCHQSRGTFLAPSALMLQVNCSLKMPTVEREITIRPPLKWAGGKRWQVPHLKPLWESHSHRRLVEPFCGGLAVTLGLMPERALLNDANPHLINFYSWLR